MRSGRSIGAALVALVILALLAYGNCELWEYVASQGDGDFPSGLLCVVGWIAAVIAWLLFVFGDPRGR